MKQNKSRHASVLLGIMSGNPERRRFARCCFSLCTQRSFVDVVYIVGRPLQKHDHHEQDLLKVPVKEARVVTGAFSTVGTAVTLIKTVFFFRYAQRQLHEVVALADDDAFLSLPLIHSLSTFLARKFHRFYAGSHEWYNWFPQVFKSTGWGPGPKMSAYMGQVLANCSVPGNRSHSREAETGRCTGPFSFAKGPFLMLSRIIVIELLASSSISSDFQRALQLGRVEHPVHHDVQLGLWMTQVSSVAYVSIQPDMWQDRRGAGHYPAQSNGLLVSAHRLPWVCWRNATRTACGISAAGMFSFSARCVDEPLLETWTARSKGARSCVVTVQHRAVARMYCTSSDDVLHAVSCVS